MDDGITEMLRFWLNFMRQHRTLLQTTVICAKEPENLYPEVSVENETEEILVHLFRRKSDPSGGRKENLLLCKRPALAGEDPYPGSGQAGIGYGKGLPWKSGGDHGTERDI